MAGRMARSWALTKQSWHVLMEDKHLMVFPLISGIITCLIAAGAIVPAVVYFAAAEQNQTEEAVQDFIKGPLFWAAVFAVYFVSFTVVTYFNAALVACVIARFEGRDSSAMAGLKVATARLPKILAWALLSSTVGVALSMLKERAGFIASLFLKGAEVVWAVATFFVVPVLVVDNVGPIDAVKKSVDVLKKTWGESLVAQFGASIVLEIRIPSFGMTRTRLSSAARPPIKGGYQGRSTKRWRS